jgi:hypothetical protein
LKIDIDSGNSESIDKRVKIDTVKLEKKEKKAVVSKVPKVKKEGDVSRKVKIANKVEKKLLKEIVAAQGSNEDPLVPVLVEMEKVMKKDMR